MAGVKRKLEEWDVSDIKPSKKAVVHGVVTALSPIKTSHKNSSVKYFDGRLSDGGNSVRLISFDPTLRSSLATSSEEGTTICINNCQVKPDKDGGNEITLSTETKIDQSPRKHPVQATDLSKITQVDDIPHLANGQQVNVKVKVVTLGQSVEVNNRKGVTLKKQDCVIADVSGSIRLVLWENDISNLAVDKCYDLKNISVGEYEGNKYLSFGSNGQLTECGEIGEVGEVKCCDVESIVSCREVIGEIDGVNYCEEYITCISCKSKAEAMDDIVARCKKCGMLMKISKTKKSLTARILISDNNGYTHNVTMFDKVIRDTIGSTDHIDINRELLKCPTLRFFISNKDIVISISKTI